jgi:2-keto-4-pentenoate hydratase/2-oxohepta-3-ene-1,7-dioic acid hydratase in catechol pathway
VKELDYEVELAVILGKECKNISEESAYDAVFGYMILNDISARDIQFKDKQFTRAKSFDTFAPCGPWITTKDEIDDPHNLQLLTKINGDTRQDSSTKNMHLKIPQIISRLSKVMTLEAGDIISTGTPEGVALGNPDFPFLKNGDLIEMEVEGLGAIKNTVKFVD